MLKKQILGDWVDSSNKQSQLITLKKLLKYEQTRKKSIDQAILPLNELHRLYSVKEHGESLAIYNAAGFDSVSKINLNGFILNVLYESLEDEIGIPESVMNSMESIGWISRTDRDLNAIRSLVEKNQKLFMEVTKRLENSQVLEAREYSIFDSNGNYSLAFNSEGLLIELKGMKRKLSYLTLKYSYEQLYGMPIATDLGGFSCDSNIFGLKQALYKGEHEGKSINFLENITVAPDALPSQVKEGLRLIK